MKYIFEAPAPVVIEFKRLPNGFIRKPLVIPRCTSVKTGNKMIIAYLARNNREHRHRYTNSFVSKIICRGNILYKSADKKRFI